MRKKMLCILCATTSIVLSACATNSTSQEVPTITNTPIIMATNTPELTATGTPTTEGTDTKEPTATDVPTTEETDTLEVTATSTPEPTVTNTPVPTATNTPKPTATNTPTPKVVPTDIPVSKLKLDADVVQAYKKVIQEYEEENAENWSVGPVIEYDFIYVTNDDIPELLIIQHYGYTDAYYPDASFSIYTYDNKKVHNIFYQEYMGTTGSDYYYGKRTGCFGNSSGYYSSDTGESEVSYSILILNKNYELESSGYSKYAIYGEEDIYYVGDKLVTEEEYINCFEQWNLSSLEVIYSADEMLKLLNNMTPSANATNTPKPTATSTPKLTATSTPKPTATNTPKPTATSTPKPTATSTPKPTTQPSSTTSSKEDIFEYDVLEDGTIEIVDVKDKKIENVIIPEKIQGRKVTSIRKWAFEGCSSLTSINIPNNVTSIGSFAFYDCSSLTSINIPNSVTSIGDDAFYCCSSLTSINIPNSVTSIGYAAFEGCSSLTSISIPNNVTSIKNSAFEGCSSLTSINIPNSVTSIGDYAFYCCSSLTSINIPNSVTSIGYAAFEGCSSLTSISIPNNVTSIGGHAFYDCSSLTSFIVEQGSYAEEWLIEKGYEAYIVY